MRQSQWTAYDHLVLVAGHAVYIADDFDTPDVDESWFLQPFQMYVLLTNRDITCAQTLAGNVTKYLKICFVVKPLQFLFAGGPYQLKLKHMRSLPEHTVGHDLAKMLDSKGLKLIPGFGKHDLNHLILRYDMTAEEELCMQAYLIGNGHWQLQCFLFLSSAVLLPGLWSTLWAHYKLGRRSAPLSSLKLKDCLDRKTEQVRREYAPPRTRIVPNVCRRSTEFAG